MGRLTARRRNALPSSAFAYPSLRKYPIHDASHARNALARVASPKNYGSRATVLKRIRASKKSSVRAVAKGKGRATPRRRTVRRRRR